MPKIDAKSVREHRAQRLDQLIEAAEAIVAEQGLEGLTAGAVAARAGIARNSIYRYFGSIEELIELVATRGFPAWMSAVTEAVAAAGPPAGAVADPVADPVARIVAYVRSNLEQAARGSHGWRSSLARESLSASAIQRVRELHQSLATILDDLVGEAAEHGPLPQQARPEIVSAVIQSLVDACIRRIDAGDDLTEVLPFACAATTRILTP